jgi:hypothetical protein
VAEERKHGNITTAMNIRAIIASCMASLASKKVSCPLTIPRGVGGRHPPMGGAPRTKV